jgi:serine/threonine-protein kinase
MGVVVAARQLQLDRLVAIKFLRPEMLGDREVVMRFQREARAASKLESAHVARVFDVDTLEDGAPFLVMEYLEGHDLSVVRARACPLEISQAVDYVLQAASALAEAHALGFVHRDVKPANLFLARQRDGSACIKVLDFGISKTNSMASESRSSVTKTSAVMGSAEYMSPEQMRSSRDVDERTDIWSLGVVLYELLTARVPFAGETITAVCARVFTEAAPSVRELRPDVPPELASVILRCLARDRDDRFATVRELAKALSPFGPPAASPERAAPIPAAPRAPAAVSAPPTLVLPSSSTVAAPLPEPAEPTPEHRGATSVCGSLALDSRSLPLARPKAALVLGATLLVFGCIALASVLSDRAAPAGVGAPASVPSGPAAALVDSPQPSGEAPSSTVTSIVVAPSEGSADPASAPSAPAQQPRAAPPKRPAPAAPSPLRPAPKPVTVSRTID